jgi:ABC-type protease/lipase transport system fused ATPase/permease subunit
VSDKFHVYVYARTTIDAPIFERDLSRSPAIANWDLDQVRSFLSGGGPTALFDLPWLPIYLAVLIGRVFCNFLPIVDDLLCYDKAL